MDMSELLGLAKKSAMSFSLPMSGIESGNSCSKKAMRSCGVLSDKIIDSGMNRVHVNDSSCI